MAAGVALHFSPLHSTPLHSNSLQSTPSPLVLAPFPGSMNGAMARPPSLRHLTLSECPIEESRNKKKRRFCCLNALLTSGRVESAQPEGSGDSASTRVATPQVATLHSSSASRQLNSSTAHQLSLSPKHQPKDKCKAIDTIIALI